MVLIAFLPLMLDLLRQTFYTCVRSQGLGLNSPVLQKHFKTSGSTSTDERGFVTPKFMGLVRTYALAQCLWGVVGATRKDVRTTGFVFLTTTLHPMHSKMQTVALLIQPGIIDMTATTEQASRAAAPKLPNAGKDPIQLHADAHNALAMTVFYLTQPQANIAGARRKAIQALSALRGLDLSAEA